MGKDYIDAVNECLTDADKERAAFLALKHEVETMLINAENRYQDESSEGGVQSHGTSSARGYLNALIDVMEEIREKT